MTPQMLLRDFVESETSKRLLPIKYKTVFMWWVSKLSTWITEGSCVPAFFINKAIDPQVMARGSSIFTQFCIDDLRYSYRKPQILGEYLVSHQRVSLVVFFFVCLLFGYFLNDSFTFDFCSLPPPSIFSSINVTAL